MNFNKYSNIKKDVPVSGNNIMPYIVDICEYMQSNGVDRHPLPKLKFSNDSKYQTDPFGSTAYYSPAEKIVVLYTAGRHIKDVLRSFCHEMIHHNQNLNGKLSMAMEAALEDPKYAQNNPQLRKLEEDAFLRGNMVFRSWEDQYK
jgi:hypothetical protein